MSEDDDDVGQMSDADDLRYDVDGNQSEKYGGGLHNEKGGSFSGESGSGGVGDMVGEGVGVGDSRGEVGAANVLNVEDISTMYSNLGGKDVYVHGHVVSTGR